MPSHQRANRGTSANAANRKRPSTPAQQSSRSRPSAPPKTRGAAGRTQHAQESRGDSDDRAPSLSTQQAVQVLHQYSHKQALSQTRRLRSAVRSLDSNPNMPAGARNIVKLADRTLLGAAERLLEKHGPAAQIHVHMLPAHQNAYPTHQPQYSVPLPHHVPQGTAYFSKPPHKPKPSKPSYLPHASKPPKLAKPSKPHRPSKPHAKLKPKPPPGYPAAPPGYPTLPAGYPAFPGHPTRR